MNEHRTLQIMGYNIYSDELENMKISVKPLIINTLNANSYVMASRDKLFRRALQNSDVLVPDGFPVVIAARFLGNKKIKKIAGADVFYFISRQMNESSGKCFFLGSSPETLNKICTRLAIEFPRIQFASYSPPFKVTFSEEDNNLMLAKINEFAPDVLFVGMTAPKQEKWVEQFKNEIQAKIICSIGAVFDFYAGTTKRPSELWLKLNLEWFIRLLREPRRLWKRYLIYSPLFFIYMIAYKYHPKFKKKTSGDQRT